jgi:hypothetical protein
MQLHIEINDTKSSMFLKLLETFKVGNIVNTYSILSDNKDKETAEILEDIAMLDMTLKDAQKGLGKHTGKYIDL